jgi:acetylglutamate kinase
MDPITVVKVGGNEIDDVEWTARLAASVAAAPSGVVIVHGGGKEISELQRALGAEPEWRDGLRVTTPQTLRAVSMVLSGWVNKRLVSVLIGAGRSAVGLSGQDGPILVAEPAQEGRLGLTGTVTSVHPSLVLGLLRMGVTPVVSPVSRGPEGGPLNVNADDAAAAIAGGIKATRFLMVSNVPGVLEDGRTIEQMTSGDLEDLIGRGVASGGMIPKLRAAMRAAEAGVPDVRIGDLGLLTGSSTGTRVVSA